MLVCTLGDLTLDVIVRLDGTDRCTRRHRRRDPCRAGEARRPTLRPGSQPSESGRDSSDRRARDDAGDLARTKLAAYGVERSAGLSQVGTGRSRSAGVTRRRALAWHPDRGAAREAPRRRSGRRVARLRSSLHVSGYALMLEPVRSAAPMPPSFARAGGARISVDLASWSAIRSQARPSSARPFAP